MLENTAMRDSAIHSREASVRSLSKAKDNRFLPIHQFADEASTKITHLDDFAATFLVKCTLGQTISRYMVLIASEQKLLMMRPYQVYQVKNIVQCIYDNCGNGSIWSTTDIGKTFTSFNASTLLKDNPDIVKCVFVVDRKDLNRQTREEFNKSSDRNARSTMETPKPKSQSLPRQRAIRSAIDVSYTLCN